jgi:hypothetical protein
VASSTGRPFGLARPADPALFEKYPIDRELVLLTLSSTSVSTQTRKRAVDFCG